MDPRRKRQQRVLAAAAVAVVLLAGAVTFPRLPTLAADQTGDPDLAATVRSMLAETPGARDRVSVAVIDGDDVTEAHFGATRDTEYEIGSVTKTMTASILAEMVGRGEIDPHTRLGDLLDLGGSAAADITLEELATQHSGLPRLAPGIGMLLSSIVSQLRASDPYGSSAEELTAAARSAKVGEKEFEYSNFGYALLGQALAVRASQGYPDLLAERVLKPLGMEDTFAPTHASDLAPDAPTGLTEGGRSSAPWTLGADAPAGSVRSTPADMVAYVRAQLDGSAPGVAATDPRVDTGDGDRIGYAWFTTEDGVTWHNGGTGGFSSWVGFDRETGRGVVILSSTATSVDDLGFALMQEATL